MVRVASENITRIGAIAIMDAINIVVGKPTNASSVTLFMIAKAAEMPLRQTTMVRIAGEIPNLIASAVSQRAGERKWLFSFTVTDASAEDLIVVSILRVFNF